MKIGVHSIRWRWTSIAMLPFAPLIALVAVSILDVVPGISAMLGHTKPFLGLTILATAIAMSIWSVVRSMREAARLSNQWALLLPLPSLAMAAMAALILGDALLKMVL